MDISKYFSANRIASDFFVRQTKNRREYWGYFQDFLCNMTETIAVKQVVLNI